MTQSLIDLVREKQRRRAQERMPLLPPHKPEMLYIGCIDARLDPIDDIGIPKGKALIYRNIAALVRPSSDSPLGTPMDMDTINAALATGEIPESVSMGATLEFFVGHIPSDGKKKHIVISGHTDCGGIDACLHDRCKHDSYLPRYLSALKEAREEVIANPALITSEQKHRALEEASVRQSIKNLMTYDVIRKAVEEDRVELHGWVIDTATQRISELDANGIFQPMTGVNGHQR
jgi:carbonic anhydrase